jgi:Rieske [2Fe-2S] domain
LRHGQEYQPRSALSFKRLWCGYLCGRIDTNELAKKLLRPVTRRAPAFVKQWWKVKPIDLKLHIASGHPGIDRYLAESYQRVRGMSSRFAAAICGHLIQRQTALGIDGELVEIGTSEGRFFIAMALGLPAGERALGIDRFDWPDPGVEDRFLVNCAQGISSDRYVSWKADSREITAGELRKKLRERPVRFVHIDSHHSRECLTNAYLSDGVVVDCIVECPFHQGRFDVRSGAAVGVPAFVPLQTFPVQERRRTQR